MGDKNVKMNKLVIACFAIIMSCTSVFHKSRDMQENSNILISESQGGADKPGFTILKNETEFQKAVKGSFGLVDVEKEPAYPKFPKDKKVVLYNLGTFRAGEHRITEIKNVSIKDNILYVEVPYIESGEMEIQMISNPWMIFTVPSDYQFNSVELKYSK